MANRNPPVARNCSAVPAGEGDKETDELLGSIGYEVLLRKAADSHRRCKSKKAVKLLEQAIDLKPDRSEAYYTMGLLHGSAAASCSYYLKAMERSPESTVQWAVAAASCYQRLLRFYVGTVSKECAAAFAHWVPPDWYPSWWNERDVLELSGRVVEHAGAMRTKDAINAWEMRGASLEARCFGRYLWRDTEQLQEAAVCYHRAAQLSPTPVLFQQYEEDAKRCKNLVPIIAVFVSQGMPHGTSILEFQAAWKANPHNRPRATANKVVHVAAPSAEPMGYERSSPLAEPVMDVA